MLALCCCLGRGEEIAISVKNILQFNDPLSWKIVTQTNTQGEEECFRATLKRDLSVRTASFSVCRDLFLVIYFFATLLSLGDEGECEYFNGIS